MKQDPWKESLKESPPADLDRRILRSMTPELAARRPERAGLFFFPLWQTGLLVGAMAAAALFFILQAPRQAGSPAVQAKAAEEFSEMVRESRLLKDLRVLRRAALWDRLEKEKWIKRRS